MIIYLYIKTHNVTGLKYFGKTSRDPFKYKGSGMYWKRHLAVHGDHVTTEIYAQFGGSEKSQLTEAALKFSEEHNIVDSPEWANLIVEDGNDGGPGFAGKSHGPEARVKISEANKLRGPPSTETRAKISDSHNGKTLSAEHRAKLSAAASNRSVEHRAKLSAAATNPSAETRAKMSAAKKGKTRGPHSPETRAKISAAKRGRSHSIKTKAKISKFLREYNATK
jgi:hypothetical protein